MRPYLQPRLRLSVVIVVPLIVGITGDVVVTVIVIT